MSNDTSPAAKDSRFQTYTTYLDGAYGLDQYCINDAYEIKWLASVFDQLMYPYRPSISLFSFLKEPKGHRYREVSRREAERLMGMNPYDAKMSMISEEAGART